MRFDGLIPPGTAVAFDEYAVEHEWMSTPMPMNVMENLIRSTGQWVDGNGVSIGKPQLYGGLKLATRCVEFLYGTT
jgi:hypothetical protein